MKNLIQLIVITSTILTGCYSTMRSQNRDIYHAAITFLSTDESIKAELLWVVGTKRSARLQYIRPKHVPFRVSSEVNWIGFFLFYGNKKCFHNISEDPPYFEPYESKQLEYLSVNHSSRLMVYFSKPYGNFLICEIALANFGSLDYFANTIQGHTLKVLIQFDEDNQIVTSCVAKTLKN